MKSPAVPEVEDGPSPSLEACLSRTRSVAIKPHYIIIISVVWAYCLNQSLLFDSHICLVGVTLLYCAGAYLLFRKHTARIDFSGFDALVLAAIFSLSVVTHWSGLFLSLGGDELYHASRSTVLLDFMQPLVLSLVAETTGYTLTGAASELLHPWLISVADIWRVLSFVLLGGMGILMVLFSRITGRTRILSGAAVVLSVAVAGAFIALGRESHPPLRTLPTFVSTLIFGFNDLGFRMPGLVVATIVAFLVYKVAPNREGSGPFTRFFLAVLTLFIPVVFYAAESVEPSIYGYAVYSTALVLAVQYLRTKDPKYILWISVVGGPGLILRQSTFPVWFLAVGCLVTARSLWNVRGVVTLFYPLLIGVPYFYTVRILGHTATGDSSSAVGKIWSSLTSGIGPATVVNSTTIPWLVITLILATHLVMRRTPWRILSCYILIVPAYSLFHAIHPYLWGIGRYQCEFVAPFIVLTLFLTIVYASLRFIRVAVLAAPVLMLVTLEINNSLALETNFKEWPKMRISSSAYFPYRDALQQLKRSQSRFVLLGGTPWYPRTSGWLAGFSFAEAAQLTIRQGKFDEFLRGSPTEADLSSYLISNNIEVVLVQTGVKRENEHRPPYISSVIGSLESVSRRTPKYLYRVKQFDSLHGGILDMYATKLER